MEKVFKSRQDRADEVMAELEQHGSYYGRDHQIEIGMDSEISVRERRTGALVAYSSTRADFEDSVAEFVYDYFV